MVDVVDVVVSVSVVVELSLLVLSVVVL